MGKTYKDSELIFFNITRLTEAELNFYLDKLRKQLLKQGYSDTDINDELAIQYHLWELNHVQPA